METRLERTIEECEKAGYTICVLKGDVEADKIAQFGGLHGKFLLVVDESETCGAKDQ